MLPPAEDTPTVKGTTKANLSVYTHAPKTHTNAKQQGGISIHVFCCVYCCCLLYVREWFVGTLVCVVRVLLYRNTCPRVATAKPTPLDALRAGVCLRALPLGERTLCVSRVCRCASRHCVYICICIRNMAPRWRVRPEVRLLLYG